MAMMRHIKGTPTFSTPKEAAEWGKKTLNIGGYHVHYYNGNKLYMAGANHQVLANAQREYYSSTRRDVPIINVPSQQSTPTVSTTTQRNVPVPTPRVSSGGGTSGGGGY